MTDSERTLSTRDRVFAICNDLYRQNRKPSVRLVLSMLPDISSTSSVHKPFKEWIEEMEAQQQSLYDKLGFSEEFTQAFMREITRFGVEAEDRYKSMTSDAKEQRNTAVEDLERTEERYFKQSTLVEQQAKVIRALKTEAAESKRAQEATVAELRQQLDDEHTANQELISTNEGLRTELAKIRVQLDNNEALVSELKNNAKEVTQENRELRKAQSSLDKELARLETTLDGRQQLIDELKASAGRYESLITELRQEKTALKDDLTRQRQQLDDTKQQLADAKSKQAEQLQTTTDLRNTVAEQSRVIARLTPDQNPPTKL